MSLRRRSGFGKWPAIALASLFLAFSLCILGYGRIFSPGGSGSDSEEIVIPEHVAERAQEYSVSAAQQESTPVSDPIRKTAIIARGDSAYKILEQNSVPRVQARQIIDEVKGVFDLSRVVPGHEFVLCFSPDNQDLLAIEYEISGHDRLFISVDGERVTARKEHEEKVLPEGYDGPLRQTGHIVKKGDTLFEILRSCGISSAEIDRAVRSVRDVYNLSGLAGGRSITVWTTQEEPARLVRMTYEMNDLTSLEVEYLGGDFHARKLTQELQVRYERAEGTITSSLYESAVNEGLAPEIVMGLSDVYAWDINFFTDISAGDSFTVLYERFYVQDAFKGYGRIVAARFVNRGREHTAIHYANGRDIDGYYDEKGKPVEKLFLKAPLNYRRISSGFTCQRRHPIFHVMRPHLGVDYAAPIGTPVVALGQGKIIFKGWMKGFGKCIQVRHPAGYVSYYGHLRGYPRGLSRGDRVAQGEIIGFVGMTGNTTGPHLDFRVRLRGKFINPLTLKPVNGPPLKGRALARFREISGKRLAMLENASLNYTTKLSSR